MNRDEFLNMSQDDLAGLAGEQKAALATYKETLSRIYQEFDAKIGELSLIRRVSDLLRGAEGLGGVALSMLEVVISELPADHACLMLTDPEMTFLAPLAFADRQWEAPRPAEEPGREDQLPLGEGPLGQAVAAGRILIMPSLTHEELEPWPAFLPYQAQSLMAIPLLARQEIMGVMLLVAHSPDTFGEEHARTLTIICDHAASALANQRLIGQLGDINERLLASELEAHQAREYLQHILDTAGDVILIAGADGQVNYANQTALNLGFSQEGLIGRPLPELFAEPAKAAAVLSRALAQSEELEFTTPEGPRHVLVNTTPLADTKEVLAILRDITQRRALERQLLHAEKLASVGILAAGVAHEIGNPLSAISGYAQLLTKDDVDPEDKKEFAEAIASQSERINKIIRDLLDYSRPSPYAGQTTEVNRAVEAVLNMFFTEKRLRDYSFGIERCLARGLPPVAIDKDQLQQVVLNMAMNAAQAMESAGESGGRLTITTREENGAVLIIFADTGPGIAPGQLPLVFDPFFTTKQSGQGTGLGLSICDRIINQAGGRIAADSTTGLGATFTVVLPAADGEDLDSSPEE